jgi:hypothetical protein
MYPETLSRVSTVILDRKKVLAWCLLRCRLLLCSKAMMWFWRVVALGWGLVGDIDILEGIVGSGSKEGSGEVRVEEVGFLL